MSGPVSTTIVACRACSNRDLVPFLDLGSTPLADRLLTEEQLNEPEPMVPLEVVFCERCGLVQISETVDPEVLFCQNYPYYSSVSPSLMAHFEASAASILQTRGLDHSSLVMEAASNDGYMLRHFRQAGVGVLGIDPADGPATKAQQAGVPTLNVFFGLELARQLVAEGKRADVFLANNVLAHVADLNGFVEGIATVLKDDGVAVIECPYLLDLIEHREFDTIYHQHLCYYSVTALTNLFRQHGLSLNDVQRVSVHGGSLRLFVEKAERVSPSVRSMLAHEIEVGATKASFYADFARTVADLKRSLMHQLTELKAQGKRIVGYAAPAKGCTLMSYCGIGSAHLDYLVDLNPVKHGRYMGGNRLRIEPVSRLSEDRPDYALILAWNFADEIIQQLQSFSDQGGHFIVPVPNVRVI
ncbi:MAG: class I SAM-dependent methyltransferase [Myxococcales bacterium]|nr:class I SAM-dependent methyltransferase [Myxococcales bacterium]